MRTRIQDTHGTLVAAALAVALAAAGGCEPLTFGGAGDASVEVRLEGSAAQLLQEVEVDIGAVTLVPRGAADSTGRVLTTNGTSGYVDLLRIQPLTRPELTRNTVQPDRYTALLVEIEAVRVELTIGYGFSDEGGSRRTLPVPDGVVAGLRLDLDQAGDLSDDSIGVEIEFGNTRFMLDIDAVRSFTFYRAPGLETVFDSVAFDPAVRVVEVDLAGSIAGTVTASGDATAAGLVVTATALDAAVLETFQTRGGTAVTDADGAYTIDFLPPGEYAVRVTPPDDAAVEPTIQGVTIAVGQDVTGIGFQVSGGQ